MGKNYHLVITLLAAFSCATYAGDYRFEVLETKGSPLSIETPNPTPAGFAIDYSIRANSIDALIQISCTSLQFGQGKNCNDAGLTVSDGDSEEKICASQTGEFVFESQAGAKVKVSLRAGPNAKVVCTAKAIPNPLDKFLIFESEEVDSSLHGLAPGIKTTTCPCGSSNKARIVGGTETKPNEYPFIVGMVNVDTMFLFCGASIISKKHALTAAHCTFKRQDKKKLGIVMGFHDIVTASVYKSKHGEVARISQVIEHENYDNNTLRNDISLLVLTNPIEFTTNIQPVCLPNKRIPLEDKFIKVLGWGKISSKGPMSDVLLEVNLKVLPLKVCANKYLTVSLDNPAQVCTYGHGKDSCQGDSGGPLVWLDPETNRYTLVALVSFGRDCAAPDTPGVNTELGFYLQWINKQIAATSSGVRTCSKVD